MGQGFLAFPLVLLGFPWFSFGFAWFSLVFPPAPLWSVTPGGPARRPPCGTSCPGGCPAAPLWNVRRRPARRRKTKENQRKTKQNQRKTKQNQGKPRKTKKIRGIPLGGGGLQPTDLRGPIPLGGGACNPQPHIIYGSTVAPTSPLYPRSRLAYKPWVPAAGGRSPLNPATEPLRLKRGPWSEAT